MKIETPLPGEREGRDREHADLLADVRAFVEGRKLFGLVLPPSLSGDGEIVKIIDGLGPDGISQVTVDLARRAGKLQTGYVYHYAFAMMIGVVALVSWYLVAFRG